MWTYIMDEDDKLLTLIPNHFPLTNTSEVRCSVDRPGQMVRFVTWGVVYRPGPWHKPHKRLIPIIAFKILITNLHYMYNCIFSYIGFGL